MNSPNESREYQRGLAYALTACAMWGVMPLYFHLIRTVGPIEIVCHRVVWSVAFLLGLLALKGELRAALRLVADRRTLRTLLLTAALTGGSWLLYLYAFTTGRTLEASFGYFISPLLTIALGVTFLCERLSRLQIACLTLAAAGIAVRLWALGTVPWIALGLALSSGIYGLVRKRAGIPPVAGLAVETVLVLPAAIFGLSWFAASGQLAFTSQGLRVDLLLVSAGLLTSVPLILYLAGAQRLPLSSLGFLQYVAPSLQFLLALTVLGESLSAASLASFSFIWAGLLALVAARAGAPARVIARPSAGPPPQPCLACGCVG